MNKLIRLALLAILVALLASQWAKTGLSVSNSLNGAPPAPEFEERSFGNEATGTGQLAPTKNPHQNTSNNNVRTVTDAAKQYNDIDGKQIRPTNKKIAKANDTAPIYLQWERPQQDKNGKSIAASTIGGYVIVFLNQQTLAEKSSIFANISVDKKSFLAADKQLNRLIMPSELPKLAKGRSAQVLVINSGQQRSVALHYLPKGKYFFAISAFNSNGEFAELSNTLTVDTTIGSR